MANKVTSQPAQEKLSPFDVSKHLDSDEVIAEYLAAALEDPNREVFLRALANVANARVVRLAAAP